MQPGRLSERNYVTEKLSNQARRVAIYVRVSTKEQAEHGHSLEEQVRRLRAEAGRRGWEVVAVYVERGVSGKRDSRPELDRMLGAAESGEFDVLMIVHIDRLGRSARMLFNTHEQLRQV